MPRKASASVKTATSENHECGRGVLTERYHARLARSQAKAQAESRVPVVELQHLAQEWLLDCQLKQHTRTTIANRQDYLDKLFWFLSQRNITAVGTTELRQFMGYLANGHEETGGRWGNPQMTEPMRPVSMHGYYRVLRAWFNWMAKDGAIDFNPVTKLPAPIHRSEIKQPLPIADTAKLIKAAKHSFNPKRDEAIVLFLLDTGVRASELRALTMGNLDMASRSCRILGKGQKYRTCYFGATTAKALSRYLRMKPRKPCDPVFIGHSGSRTGEGLLPSSLFHILERIAKSAGLDPKLCAPHALRRAFAVNMLRNGANAFAVQVMLGHSGLDTTRLYVALAEADVERQHQTFSPVDKLTVS